MLKLVLSYCRYHRAEGRSDKERKLFDEKFIRMDTRRLCELTSAADACACLAVHAIASVRITAEPTLALLLVQSSRSSGSSGSLACS